jgi:hypothetical protein
MEFVKFDFERENMLLHIFRLEAKALPKRPAKKDRGAPELLLCHVAARGSLSLPSG